MTFDQIPADAIFVRWGDLWLIVIGRPAVAAFIILVAVYLLAKWRGAL